MLVRLPLFWLKKVAGYVKHGVKLQNEYYAECRNKTAGAAGFSPGGALPLRSRGQSAASSPRFGEFR